MVQSFINARTLAPSGCHFFLYSYRVFHIQVMWISFRFSCGRPDMRQPKIAAEIAKELGKFHKVNIPGPKEPQLWVDILKFFEKGFLFFFLSLLTIACSRVLAILYKPIILVRYLYLQPLLLRSRNLIGRSSTRQFRLKNCIKKLLS